MAKLKTTKPIEATTEAAPVDGTPVTEEAKTEAAPASNIPKGIDAAEYEKAKTIIVSGFGANQTEDAIKTAMFTEGIPFSNLVRLFKAISIGEGLVVSPAKIREAMDKALMGKLDPLVIEGAEVTFDADIQPIVTEVMKVVAGASEKKVIARIKAFFESNDLEMPKKPKKAKGEGGAGRTSKINAAIVNFFEANKEGTEDEFKAMLKDVTTDASAKKWGRLYKTFSAVATGLTAEAGKV